MSEAFRPLATKPALTGTLLLLTVGGTVASAAAASASPQSVPPPLGHQLCHAATATGGTQ
jgi:hypothetical protein